MPGGDQAGRSRRYEHLLWFLVLAANYIGIAIAWLYVFFVITIYPEPDREPGEIFFALLTPAILLLGVASSVGMLQSRKRVRRALRWLSEDRSATDLERREVFALPRRLATIGLTWWGIAIALLTPYVSVVLRYNPPADGIVRSFVSLVLLTLVPWSLSYLFVERALRPVFADALVDCSEPPRTMGLAGRLLLAWTSTSGLPILGVLMLVVAQDADRLARAFPALFMVCTAGIVAGVTVSVFSGRAIIDPLRRVRSVLREVERGNLSVEIPAGEAAELGELQLGVNRMVHGLRERERLREIFGHHVGADVARRAIEGGAALGGELVDATAMFVDVIASSALAEEREPNEVVDALNSFFECVVRCVGAEGGYVSKFEGDGALCIFGTPVTQPDHAARALRAACALRVELVTMSEGVDAAIGISSGKVVAGNVGTANRYEYTIIGDAVNEASRLTDEAKKRLARVLAGERTLERAGGEAAGWTHTGTIHLRGRARPTLAFEPVT